MSTKLETDDEPILERAATALRETPIPPGPSPQIHSATLAALMSSPRSPALRSFTSTGVLARAAVLACLAAGTAAAYFAVLRHHDNYARQRPASPMIPNPVIAQTSESSGSMVTGEIRFEGNAPPPRLIDFGTTAGCGERANQPMYDDSLLVNLDDTLQNVVVSVVAGLPDGKTYPEPSTPVYLEQAGCMFQPHVLAMRTGQPILLRNSDPIMHNTRSLSVRNPDFNIIQPTPEAGRKVPGPREPEIFQVQCNIHPWMKSWFCAFNHPYFDVSSANGTFTMHGLPPGHYRLRAWHERLGTLERDVVVRPGQDETINFVFRQSPAPKSPRAAAPPRYLSPPLAASRSVAQSTAPEPPNREWLVQRSEPKHYLTTDEHG